MAGPIPPSLPPHAIPPPQLYGASPEDLPSRLRADLLASLALPNTAAQAALRAGCVHLTLTALVSAEERQRLAAPGTAASALAALLPLVQRLPGRRAALQLDGGGTALLAQPSHGRPALLFSLPVCEAKLPPAVAALSPAAATVSSACGLFRLRCTAALVSGTGGLVLHCRSNGVHAPVSLQRVGAGAAVLEEPACDSGCHTSDAGSDSGSEASWSQYEEEEEECLREGDEVEVEAWVPAAAAASQASAAPRGGACWQPGWGLYEFEVARGGARRCWRGR